MAQGNTVGTAYLTLVPKLDSNMGELESGLEKAGESGGSKFSAGIGGALKKAASIGLVVEAAQLAAGMFTSSFNAAAKNEQLIGGVDTIFKEQAETIKQYANEAYKTAGISANKYMEISTSFGASLVQSLGDYAWESANVADMAIRDMSDNANKMGTDIESIQNAYQGFAKGNFTMLDNLKLGYGGTKEEMERLLRRAEEINGYEFGSMNIDSFADIIEAIHTVQEDLGIMGATAREAEDTVEGSLAMLKASWENLLTAMGTGDDIEAAAKNLVDSFFGMFKNIIPLAIQVAKGMAEGVLWGIFDLAHQGTAALQDMVWDFMQGGINIVRGMVDGISSAAGAVVEKIKSICASALDAVKSFFGIHSPSTVMRKMGGYIGEGMALGIEDSESIVEDAMGGLYDAAMPDSDFSVGGFGGGSTITIHNLTVKADDAETANAFAAMLRRAAMQYA